MIAVALSETLLCWRLSRRACKPSVSTGFEGGAVHGCGVVSANNVSEEEEQGCLLASEGEG